MTGTTITLKYPVDDSGKEISSVFMRRAKVRDIKTAEKAAAGDADREISLFANLCEVAPATIEALDMADYAQLQDAYKGFLSE